MISFVTLTITSLVAIWFSPLMFHPPLGSIPLIAFYPIKALTSFLILFGIGIDTGHYLFSSFSHKIISLLFRSYFNIFLLWLFILLEFQVSFFCSLYFFFFHFFFSRYVKEYLFNKTIEYQGIPVPYGLNPYRSVLKSQNLFFCFCYFHFVFSFSLF